MGIFNLNLGKKVIVYRSRDEADYKKAVALLKEAKISFFATDTGGVNACPTA